MKTFRELTDCKDIEVIQTTQLEEVKGGFLVLEDIAVG